MSTQAVIAHQIPGRVRLSIAGKRGDPDYFAALSRQLSGMDGIHRIKANHFAGSIVLEFAGGLQDLLERIAASALFDLAEQAIGGDGAAALADFTRPINLVSGRDINPPFMVGVAFVVLGLLQSMRGRVMVPALTAFWYATNTFQQAGMGAMLESADPD